MGQKSPNMHARNMNREESYQHHFQNTNVLKLNNVDQIIKLTQNRQERGNYLSLSHIGFRKLSYNNDQIEGAVNELKLKVKSLNNKTLPGVTAMVCRILMCDKHSLHRRIYKKTVNKIRDYLDVNTIIKNMMELQFIKSILFSRNVSELFNIFTDLKSLSMEKTSHVHLILKDIYENINNRDTNNNLVDNHEEKTKELDHYAAQFFIENFMRK